MSNDPVIPKKINRYIQRLLIEYEREKNPLFHILKEVKKNDVKISSIINYHQEAHFHKLVFLLPQECFGEIINRSSQKVLSKKLKNDLNQVKTETELDEFIEDVKFELKDEIDVQTYSKRKTVNPEELLKLWDRDCLRVFISHSAKNYNIAKKIKDCLIDFGMSCFVAHKDIEPKKKWKEEIKKALNSMEVMLLLVTEDSCKSPWVNQEIGFALSENISIIPIKLEQYDPKGFVSDIQAMSANKEDIIQGQHDIIEELFGYIRNDLPQHPAWKKKMLNKFLKAKDTGWADAFKTFMDIIDFKFNDQEIEKIVETIQGPAKNDNQLKILLYNKISKANLKILPTNKYTYYAELLRDKILSQHTKNRYSIIEGQNNGFEIIDNHQNINNQQMDATGPAEIPF